MRFFLPVIPALFLFQSAFAEFFIVKSFDTRVRIRRDAVIEVVEEIRVQFSQPRRGIYRFIPERYRLEPHQGPSGREMPVLFGNTYRELLYGIRVPGYEKAVSRENGYRVIRIGSQNMTVEGEQLYRIEYSVYGGIGFFSGHSEFYWNLTGHQWPVPMSSVSFRIILPEETRFGDQDIRFYTGPRGSTGGDVSYDIRDNVISGTATRALDLYEGVTAAIRFPAGYFRKNPVLQAVLLALNNGYLPVPLIAFLIAWAVWWKFGRDRKVTDMVEFRPPEGVTPAEAGVIIDDIADNRDLLSLIYYWAAAGFLEIEEIRAGNIFQFADYALIKKKDLPASAKPFEKTFFNGLFAHGTDGRVEVSSLKESFYTTFNQAKGELQAFIDTQEYYEPGSKELMGVFYFLAVMLPVLGGLAAFWLDWGIGYLAAGVLCAPSFGIFGFFMPKKSAKGLEQYRRLRGFRQFIRRAEKPKLEYLMKEDPKYFDRTLAYAIALGVGEEWAGKFDGLVREPPEWYHGGAFRTFSTVYFMRSLTGGMDSMRSAMTSMPSPSAGSSGGFGGGGGFSGGGGGGGGGGSW